MFEMMLGQAGVALVNWLVQNQDLFATVIGFYFLIYVAGRLQLSRVRSKTEALIIQSARGLAAENKRLTPTKLYKRIYPVWAESLKHWALYVMDTWDIWLVAPTAKALEKRTSLSPGFIADLLNRRGLADVLLDSESKGEGKSASR